MHKTLEYIGQGDLSASHNQFPPKNQSLCDKGKKKSGVHSGHKRELHHRSPIPNKILSHNYKTKSPQCRKGRWNEPMRAIENGKL